MSFLQDTLASYKLTILVLSTSAVITTSLLLLALLRLAQILPTPAGSSTDIKPPRRPPPSPTHPTHLLIVLGSGGHTAEMLNILSSLPDLRTQFTQRTYLVSSGDSFSAGKAVEFEKEHAVTKSGESNEMDSYTVVTVRRARRVHQSFLTTPLSTLLSLWDCIAVLRGTHPDFTGKGILHTYPDLILTNGPGTGVCVVIAALVLRFFGYCGSLDAVGVQTPDVTKRESHAGQGQMRTVFIESWARVKTLSLSGKILRPLVNRFLVQWPQLAEIAGPGVEYIGPLVS